MKNSFKLFGIIVLAMIIGFSMVACEDDTGGDPALSGNITISPSGPVTTGTLLTATYSGTETVTFQWRRGTENVGTASTTNPNTFTPTEAGSYTVTVSAEGFQSKTSAAVTVTAAGGPGPDPNVTWTIDSALFGRWDGTNEGQQNYNGQFITFSANGIIGSGAQWDVISGEINSLPASNKTVVFQNGKGIFAGDEDFSYVIDGTKLTINRVSGGNEFEHFVGRQLEELAGTVTITPNTGSIFVGQTLRANYDGEEEGARTFRWSRNGAEIAGHAGAGITLVATEAGSYTVTVSLPNFQPKTSAAVTVTVSTLQGPTSWTDWTSNNTINTISPSYLIFDITYGDGAYIAVGRTYRGVGATLPRVLLRSVDYGETWSTINVNTFFTDAGTDVNGVAFGNGTFVAVRGTTSGELIYSTNGGSTWTAASAISGMSRGLNSIIFADGRFYAVGSFGVIVSSANGITWSNQMYVTAGTGSTNRANDIAFGGGNFVAVGREGWIARSTDGTSWTYIQQDIFGNTTDNSDSIEVVAYGNGVFVAAGQNGKMIRSTDGGLTWTAVNNSTFENPGITQSNLIHSLSFGDGIFAASGFFGNVALSDDGLTWTPVTGASPFTASARTIIHDGFRFIIAGDGGIVAFSPEPPATPITLESVTSNGDTTVSTTELTLVFSAPVPGLTADHIILSNSAITKGTLSGTGPEYTLPISGFNISGQLNVNMAPRRGFQFLGTPVINVQIHHVTPVTFQSVTANGSTFEQVTTTQLTLTFSAPITGLSADDITLAAVPSMTLVKGNLTHTGNGIYTLPITGITAAGTVTVTVAQKTGFNITGTPGPVQIHLGRPVPPTVTLVRTQTGVTVSWDPVPTATSYTIERAVTNTEASFVLAGTTTTETTFTATIVGEDSSGWIRVRATNSIGSSNSLHMRFESFAVTYHVGKLEGTWRNNIDSANPTGTPVTFGREIRISGTSWSLRDPANSTSFTTLTVTGATAERINFTRGSDQGSFNYKLEDGILLIWNWSLPGNWRMDDRFTTAENGNPNNTIDEDIFTSLRTFGVWYLPMPPDPRPTIVFAGTGANPRTIASSVGWNTMDATRIKHLDSNIITFGNTILFYTLEGSGTNRTLRVTRSNMDLTNVLWNGTYGGW
jgi:hypothetical protein